MAKGKGKRKTGGLSQMERAIMTAFNHRGMRSRESCHDSMMTAKTNYKTIPEDFDFMASRAILSRKQGIMRDPLQV